MKKLSGSLFLLFIGIAASAQITWSAAINIATSSYDNKHPRIVTDRSGNPLVIWGRSSDESVFFSRWNGTGFTMPVKVNTGGITVATADWMGPDIASKGDTVYVVMKETPEGDTTKHVLIARSLNGGTSFSAPVRVDRINDSLSRFPVVTTDASGNPLVGFMKFDPSFGSARWVVAKSTDLGSTFSTDHKASGWSGPGALVCDCCPGSLVCSANTVAMLYRDNLSNIRDMWAGISYASGNSFTQGLAYDQGNWLLMSCPSSGPDGTIIGDSLYTTYMSAASGDALVYHNSSSLSSPMASAGIPHTGAFSGLTQQNYPRIASAGTALTTVWRQSVSGTDYLVCSFTDNVSGGVYEMDTIAMSGVTNGDVAMAGGKILVVWQDYNSGTVKYRTGTYTSTTGIAETQPQSMFSVFPNPADDHTDLLLSDAFAGENVTITIINATGKKVMSNVLQPAQGRISIDTKGLAPGIYFIRAQSATATGSGKIMIRR